jgi:tripartite-type tricarboxylate transporter receptor subunit TctC
MTGSAKIRRVAGALALGLLASASAEAAAQDYPARPVRLVVPSAPGGGNDLIARIVAEKLTAKWGATMVVDNRAGGSGALGAQIVATSRPDGYTLMNATGGHITINPLLRDMPYDAANAFTPISILATAPYLMVVNPSVVQSRLVKEFIALAKGAPGKYLYGSAVGSPDHLAGELFQLMTGTRLTHVPYKSSAGGTIDLLGGRLALGFVTIPAIMPHIQSGKMRALGSSDRKRSPLLPEVPTIAEAGVPGYELFTWYGLFGPAKMPAGVLGKVAADIRGVLAEADVRQKLQGHGYDTVGNRPEEAAAFIRKESAVFAKIVAGANLRERFKTE